MPGNLTTVKGSTSVDSLSVPVMLLILSGKKVFTQAIALDLTDGLGKAFFVCVVSEKQ
jgi:hypothetical protein